MISVALVEEDDAVQQSAVQSTEAAAYKDYVDDDAIQKFEAESTEAADAAAAANKDDGDDDDARTAAMMQAYGDGLATGYVGQQSYSCITSDVFKDSVFKAKATDLCSRGRRLVLENTTHYSVDAGMCTRPSEPRPGRDPRPMSPRPRRDQDVHNFV